MAATRPPPASDKSQQQTNGSVPVEWGMGLIISVDIM
jgi:hypothetical protein